MGKLKQWSTTGNIVQLPFLTDDRTSVTESKTFLKMISSNSLIISKNFWYRCTFSSVSNCMDSDFFCIFYSPRLFIGKQYNQNFIRDLLLHPSYSVECLCRAHWCRVASSKCIDNKSKKANTLIYWQQRNSNGFICWSVDNQPQQQQHITASKQTVCLSLYPIVRNHD